MDSSLVLAIIGTAIAACALVVGIIGLRQAHVAGRNSREANELSKGANRRADQANQHAEEANRIATVANAVAEKSLTVAADETTVEWRPVLDPLDKLVALQNVSTQEVRDVTVVILEGQDGAQSVVQVAEVAATESVAVDLVGWDRHIEVVMDEPQDHRGQRYGSTFAIEVLISFETSHGKRRTTVLKHSTHHYRAGSDIVTGSPLLIF